MGLFDGLSLFGYTLSKDDDSKKLETFELEKDSAVDIMESNQIGGAYAYTFETVTVPTAEVDMIKTYRDMSKNSDVDLVLNEIRNEVFIYDVPGKKALDISFDENTTGVSKAIQKKIHEEFDAVYKAINFRERGYDLFDNWYVDGRLYIHKIVDSKRKKDGILSAVIIDPLKIKRIREVPKKDARGLIDLNKVEEYFIYTDVPTVTIGGQNLTTVNYQGTRGLKIQKDAVGYIDSGIYDGKIVQGFLHKAIIPFNNLKLMEESLLIYRVSRAPERRVIYVDVGNLPKNKAEQYVRDMMNRFRNKLVYDSKNGGLADKRNVLSMMEDYWFPRRDGGKGTEVTTLPGGENLGITEDVKYFKDKLMDALNVPASRFSEQAPSFAFGKGIEINRDEYRFKKFLSRLRNRFVTLFLDLLKTQLLLKNIITEDDWDGIVDEIVWVFAEDNNFVEFKESETLNNRINTLTMVDPFVGKYFPKAWVMKEVMKMTDKQIEAINKMVEEEVAENAAKGLDSGGNPIPPPEPDDAGPPGADAGGPGGGNQQPEQQNQQGEKDGGPPFI